MIDIKQANIEHLETIANFQKLMALETENLDLPIENLNKGVKKFFDEPFLGKYLIATSKDEIVGCLLIQYEWSDWRNAFVIWLHSVYVLPEYRKKGVFAEMYKYVKKKVETSDEYTGIRLFVDKTNVKAQKVYEKMGMSSEHYELFEWLK